MVRFDLKIERKEERKNVFLFFFLSLLLGVKMGRIPKLVKERALKELKEQQMKEEAAIAESNEAHSRTASCSSLSDRSIENYDPNAMETGN
jgi:hypothetical protein